MCVRGGRAGMVRCRDGAGGSEGMVRGWVQGLCGEVRGGGVQEWP